MIAEAWQEIWKKPDRRAIYEWGAKHVYLPAGVYTRTGPFDVTGSRHFIAPFGALHNDLVHQVSVRWPVRTGKSLIADVWLQSVLVRDPGPFMWNLCTDKLAKRHAPTRVIPVMQACELVSALLPRDIRKVGQEMIFRNGMPFYIQGPSLGNLTGVGIRYLVEDELWQRSHASHAEAQGRLGDYEKLGSAKELDLSQGGVEGDAEDEEWSKGTQSEWHVQCIECAKFYVPRTTGYRDDGSRWGLIWDKEARSPGGQWNIPKVLETLRYECPHCAHPNVDEHRVKTEWNRTGKYVVQNPDAIKGHESFHVYSTIDRPWAVIAKKLVNAQNAFKRGVIDLLRTFTQKEEARTWSEQLIQEQAPEKKVVYEVTSEWKEEACRIMTVDKQGEGLFWVVIRAWSKEGKSRRLYFNRAYGWAEIEKLQKEWKVEPMLTLVDAGYEPKGPDGVYAACCRNGWIAIDGKSPKKKFIHSMKRRGQRFFVEKSYSPQTWGDPESGRKAQGRTLAKLIHFAKPTINARLQRLRASGLFMVPAGGDPELEKEYSKQMAAEYLRRERDPDTGRVAEEWVCPSGNNHAWDCEGMQVLAATILQILPDSFDGEELGAEAA